MFTPSAPIFLTRTDLSRLFGVHRATLTRWAQMGYGPAPLKFGPLNKGYRYTLQSVLDFIENSKVLPAAAEVGEMAAADARASARREALTTLFGPDAAFLRLDGSLDELAIRIAGARSAWGKGPNSPPSFTTKA